MSDLLLTTFRFAVTLNRVTGDGQQSLGDGGFQEVSGLEVELDVSDYEEGGRNDAITRRIGRAKFQPLVCKRGMFASSGTNAEPEMWQWFQDIVGGIRPVRRYDGRVVVRTQEGDDAATWLFQRAIPTKIVGPTLNAKNGDIAIEELHLAHEGLQLDGTT